MKNEPKNIEELLEAISSGYGLANQKYLIETYLRRPSQLSPEQRESASRTLQNKYPEIFKRVSVEQRKYRKWGVTACITAGLLAGVMCLGWLRADRSYDNAQFALVLAEDRADSEKKARVNAESALKAAQSTGQPGSNLEETIALQKKLSEKEEAIKTLEAKYMRENLIETGELAGAIRKKEEKIAGLERDIADWKNELRTAYSKNKKMESALDSFSAKNKELEENIAALEDMLQTGIAINYRDEEKKCHYIQFNLYISDTSDSEQRPFIKRLMRENCYYMAKEDAEATRAAAILSSGSFRKSFDRLWIKAQYADNAPAYTLISEDSSGKEVESKNIDRLRITQFIKSVLSKYVGEAK